jgi:hypothetical protein
MRVTSAGLAAVLAAACVSNPAPRGWLPPAQITAREAYGGWIVVDTAQPDRRSSPGSGLPAADVAGELIAVDSDTVFVMPLRAVVGIPKARVRSATLFAYDAEWGRLVAWDVLGTLFTVSNGGFALLTFPMMLITSTAATASRSRAPRVELADSPDRWAQLRLYARFPQGMPPGIDRAGLQPAPRLASERPRAP